MLTGAAGRSNPASGRHGQFLAFVIAGVVGLAVGGVAAALLVQPQLNVAAQPQARSATRELAVDNFLEAQLIREARTGAAVGTASRISVAAQRAGERVLESRLLTEARALGVRPTSLKHPRSTQRVAEDVLEARLITEARLLADVSPREETSAFRHRLTAYPETR
jgi:hypothetical protein